MLIRAADAVCLVRNLKASFGSRPTLKEPIDGKYSWESSLSALQQALKMEKAVTEHIKKIIDYCADAEDHQVSPDPLLFLSLYVLQFALEK